MPLDSFGPNYGRIRHRIAEIELRPTTSNRQISAKVLVDKKVVCELPWIAKGQPLRWTRPIVCNAFPDSRVVLEVCEKHTMKDQRFRSNEYIVSRAQQQAEIIVGFVDISWNATLRLLTPARAEAFFAAGLDKLQNMKSTPTPLEKLGKARPVFEAILQLGSAVSEFHPAAKVMFAICTTAWEKLEEREKYNESVQELVNGLTGITDFVELVEKHARMERLKATISDILILLEDVSIYIVERESTSSTAQTFRGFFDSSDRDKVEELLSRFERLRAEFDTGVGTETHKTVQMIDLHALLNQLQPVNPSGYDPSRACQVGTRVRIISDILSWTEQSENPKSMLWIHGQAGMGKSSIATSVCQQLANKKLLAASFFCKRDDPNLRDPLRLINSVVHGLAISCPSYGQLVAAAIQENRELCTAHIEVRYEGLIMRPLQALRDPSVSRPLVLLVDALDECGTDETRRKVLKHLSDLSKLVPWLQIIVTSRPDEDIQGFLQDLGDLHVSSRNVHDFDASDDIRAYIELGLGAVASKHNWPEGSIDQLCSKAGGVFIWAATVGRYITRAKGSTVPRLLKVLEDQKSTVLDSLDALYAGVILAGMKDVEEDNKTLFRQCIGAIVVASMRRPLSISELGSLLSGKLDAFALDKVVNSLGSVLHVDKHAHGAVRFYHPSFADYVTDPSRSGDFYIYTIERNIELAEGCLATMRRELRFNICELETSYIPNSQVPNLHKRIGSQIGGSLDYACTYWISHLIDTPRGTLVDEVERLLNSPQQLYWLEVLSLLCRVSVGLTGLLELKAWLSDTSPDLSISIDDMYKFISAFYDAISTSTPHIYVSAVALAPKLARIVKRSESLFPNTVTVRSGGDRSWPRWLKVLVQPTFVLSLAISFDGHLIVTGSVDCTVRIWDGKLGTQVGKSLIGHRDCVQSVAFSPDGSCIVSGSLDSTVRLWDTKSGAANGEALVGHSDGVSSVAFSPDGTRIVSGSHDNTVRLWDARSGAAIGGPLLAHSAAVCSVAFSPGGGRIVSGSHDMTLQLWDTKSGGAIGEPLAGHSSTVNSVSFSPDGSRIVSGSWDDTVRVWDAQTGAAIGEPLLGHSEGVLSVAFSPDGSLIVSGSHDKSMRLWDAKSSARSSEPFVGHSEAVCSVAFSPDGMRIVSGSRDGTVRLWDTKSSVSFDEPLAGHSDAVRFVKFSPDGDSIISGSDDRTVRIWDAESGAAIGEPHVWHPKSASSVAFSPEGNDVVSDARDNTVGLGDAETGAEIGEPLLGYSGGALPAAFGPDEGRTLSGFRDKVAQLRDAKTGVISFAFSPNGDCIVTGSRDNALRLWDAETGAAIGEPLLGHSGGVTCVVFSSNSSLIVSGSYDCTVRLWDVKSSFAIGKPLVGHSDGVLCVAFSLDGSRIVSGSRDNRAQLWDTRLNAPIGEPLVHFSAVLSVAFSRDGDRIVSGSLDGTVRLWNIDTRQEDDGIYLTNSTSLYSHGFPSLFRWPPHTFALPPHPIYQGWVSLDGKSLLLWLPPQYRRIYDPRALYSISVDPSKATIYLDFSKFAHGTSWASVAREKVRQNLA